MAFKLKIRTMFPASVTGAGGIDVTKTGINYVISPTAGVLGDVTGPGPGAAVVGEIAVFTDGNNIEGSGVQSADLVSSDSIRTKLSADTTFWVRSDGADTHDGSANAAGTAFLTWNALYAYVAANYDFNGYIVTLKSGTSNVYAGGLFMNTAWIGGGALIIDGGNGGIAETTTKAIINNVVQPGPVYIQNFAAGIATTLGSAVQNSAPGNLYILAGNVFGTCTNAHLEAIQGGNIYCQFAYDLAGTGAGQHVYAAYGSTVVLFGAVRLLSNQTFSNSFVYVEEGANLQAAGFSINLNGFTVTGPRYTVKAGRINTGGGGENFFPGTSAGVKSNGGIYDTTSGVANRVATATNDSATAGSIGEYMEANVKFASATVTMTIAAPCVVTWPSIPYSGVGNWTAPVKFTTSGALPTGVVSGTQYWVIGSSVSGNTFQVATSIANALAGVAITTTGSQSGTHTGDTTRALTTNTAADVGALGLTAGDWEAWGTVAFSPNAATTSTYYAAWTTPTAATAPTSPNNGGMTDTSATFSAGNAPTISAGRKRHSLSGAAPVYLGTIAIFAVNTNASFGFIAARRIR